MGGNYKVSKGDLTARISFSVTLICITGGQKMTIKITSSAFTEGSMIPNRYTCDAEDVSPDLAWTGVPEGTNSGAYSG